MMPSVTSVPVVYTKRNVRVEMIHPDKLRFYFSHHYAISTEELKERILKDVGEAGLPYVDKIAAHIEETFKVPHDMKFHAVDAKKILDYYNIEGTGITVLEGVYPIMTIRNAPAPHTYFEVDIAIENWEMLANPDSNT
jgi:hypothetical protein